MNVLGPAKLETFQTREDTWISIMQISYWDQTGQYQHQPATGNRKTPHTSLLIEKYISGRGINPADRMSRYCQMLWTGACAHPRV